MRSRGGTLAELAADLATDATIADAMRRIPKGMAARDLVKAHGTVSATARMPAISIAAEGSELRLPAEVRDAIGEIAFDADITMRISPRKGHELAYGELILRSRLCELRINRDECVRRPLCSLPRGSCLAAG